MTLKLTPVLTEKSLRNAKEGLYTFRVDSSLTKNQIKELVNRVFKVNVTRVRTIKEQAVTKKNWAGRVKKVMPSKKAIVALKEKEKIEVFEKATK